MQNIHPEQVFHYFDNIISLEKVKKNQRLYRWGGVFVM